MVNKSWYKKIRIFLGSGRPRLDPSSASDLGSGTSVWSVSFIFLTYKIKIIVLNSEGWLFSSDHGPLSLNLVENLTQIWVTLAAPQLMGMWCWANHFSSLSSTSLLHKMGDSKGHCEEQTEQWMQSAQQRLSTWQVLPMCLNFFSCRLTTLVATWFFSRFWPVLNLYSFLALEISFYIY